MPGKITLILGPMFSSKTTTLLSYYERSTLSKKKTLLIKYLRDVRYSSDSVVTHSDRQIKADIIIDNLVNDDVYRLATEADHIFIDEAQFYSGIVRFCNNFANLGKKIYLCGLNGDHAMEPFENISLLVPLANKIIKLNGICMKCRNSVASYTFRMSTCQDQELIGGEDIYMCVCRECFTQLTQERDRQLSAVKTEK